MLRFNNDLEVAFGRFTAVYLWCICGEIKFLVDAEGRCFDLLFGVLWISSLGIYVRQ